MKTKKKTAILYWTTTTIIFLFEGVIPAFTAHTELAREGIMHLGYPLYFGTMLTVFKVVGALALILPMVESRYKEWAYAGFGITMIAAFVSVWVVDGVGIGLIPSVVFFAILATSYVQYHKLHR